MIITVTTSTVTTIAAMGLTSAAGIAAAVCLIVFLASKELTNNAHTSVGSPSMSVARVARFLNVAILPLAITFIVIAAISVIGIAAA